MKIKHNAEIIVGDYEFAESLNKEVLHQLKYATDHGHTNVKGSMHTGWDWLPDNQKFKNFKSLIECEIQKKCVRPLFGCEKRPGSLKNFWGNVYKKGDYAQYHDHLYYDFSFAYFVKAKWYDSPLVFTDSGKKIRPKEGRYVIFPACLKHHVPKHRYNHDRITLSGNYRLNKWE